MTDETTDDATDEPAGAAMADPPPDAGATNAPSNTSPTDAGATDPPPNAEPTDRPTDRMPSSPSRVPSDPLALRRGPLRLLVKSFNYAGAAALTMADPAAADGGLIRLGLEGRLVARTPRQYLPTRAIST